METGVGVVIMWTILLLTAASDLNGDSTVSAPSLTLSDIISTVPHVTPKINIVEIQPSPAQSETLHTADTAFPHSTEINTQANSTQTTGQGVKIEATQASTHRNPPLTSLKSTAVTPDAMITLTAFTAASTSYSEEHRATSHQSTTSASETIPTTSSGPSSRLASTLTALIDRIQPSRPVPLENSHQDGPSELDVGDEDSSKVPHASPWDPLLAALVSIFIVSTALVSVMLFLRFRQQSEHPEFHRLQDLPMDDLLEDTPLSRYSY